MTPMRFGEAGRALFGLHLPPSTETSKGRTVVLCNPFGQEAIRCQRMMRVLAERLAREGCHVLRFDYYATGDSDGDDGEGDLETWIGDVIRARDESVRRAAHPRTSWFGLRLGASLAALASARAGVAPDRLVLWDPIVDGSAYLSELDRLHALEMESEAQLGAPRVRAESSGAREALGYPLGQDLVRQLSALHVDALATARATRVDLLHSAGASGIDPLRMALERAHAPVRVHALSDQIVWAADATMNTSVVPADALQAIVASLTDPG